ncbi:hypothetical protein L246_20320 [Salmonella enterica subsp. enterica serovar Worthington str. BCH-5715]|nr:hypothetical protein L246_20320 [Salmonella enterica subsp. enterica serovar Worthington str. BCH-5715]KAF0788173.1 hypothetical protein L243_04355 [Salmonella enterica subsp. enterica serovar Worthington str. BCH-3008]
MADIFTDILYRPFRIEQRLELIRKIVAGVRLFLN